MVTGIRLQKVLSRAGIASRRRAESLILEGRVRVNGLVVSELGTRVDPAQDTVTVDGRPVQAGETEWVVLHKPRGYVCTRHDPQSRPTVYDLLPPRMQGLFTVGRLDMDSEGLLLLTNDGDAAQRLLHPRYGADRVYEVDVRGEIGDTECSRLRSGVQLEDGQARAHAVELRTSRAAGRSRLRLLLREGRKREVRRMLEAVGHPVIRLRRVRYGPVHLGRMRAGEWRGLAAGERAAIEALKTAAPVARAERPGKERAGGQPRSEHADPRS